MRGNVFFGLEMARIRKGRTMAIQALLPVQERQARDTSVEGRLYIARLLRKALREARDPNWRTALTRACRLEEAALIRELRTELAALSADAA
jgi:hypothetical protein